MEKQMPPDNDEQSIRALISTWMRATAAGDTATVLTLMADDVVFLMPGHAPMQGKQAFAAAQQAMKGMKMEGSSDIREVRVQGDWAWCWTALTVTVTPEGGQSMRRSGHTLSVLQKRDGRWLLLRDANMLAPDKS
jgi:uncharacterized protein (TIGR02246 family)